ERVAEGDASSPVTSVTPYVLAALAEARLGRGNVEGALAAAIESRRVLDEVGHAEGGGAGPVELAYAKALAASGDRAGATWVIEKARERLLAQASRIADEELRKSFLERVPENATTLRLAREWAADRARQGGYA